MKRCVLIARVSTDRQEQQGLSIEDMQLPRLREYAQENDFIVAKEFPFSESADQKVRNEFLASLDYVKKNEIDAVLVFRVDRITRNYRDASVIEDLIKDNAKEFHFVDRRLVLHKYSESSSWDDWALDVFLAKRDINRLRGYGLATKNTKLKKGEAPGYVPMGYENSGEGRNKTVVVVEEKAEYAKKIFEWYANNDYSARQIVDRLKKDYDFSYSHSSVYNHIRNQFFIGLMYDQQADMHYPHNYDLFIDEDLFYKANARLNASSHTRKKTSSKGTYQGLIKCAECGRTLSPDPKKGKYFYYRCVNKDRPHKIKAPEQAHLDKMIVDILKDIKINDKALGRIRTILERSIESNSYDIAKIKKNLNKQVEEQDTMIKNAVKDRAKYGDDGITMKELQNIRHEATAKKNELMNKLSALARVENDKFDESLSLLELVNKGSELYQLANRDEKREMLKLVFSNFTWDGNSLDFNLLEPFNLMFECKQSKVWLRGKDSNLRPNG